MSDLNTAQPVQISSLNLLRGVAALSVCLYHVIPNGLAIEKYPMIKEIFMRGHLGLDVFFVITGFIIPYSMYQNGYQLKKIHLFLLKRFARIEPPYIISFLMVFLMFYINGWMNGWEYTANKPQFWSHFLYLNQYLGYNAYSVVYWSLAIELQFYILMALTYPLIMHKNPVYTFGLLAFFGVLSFFLVLPWNQYLFQFGFHFLAGIVVFLFKAGKIKWPVLFLSMSACLFFIGRANLEIALAVFFTVLCILFLKRSWKIPDFFGKISYSLYLSHSEFTGWSILLLRSTIKDEIGLKILAITGAIIFAYLFYLVFEKPSLWLSKKIKYTKANAESVISSSP